jgi:hypothetical protein
MDFIERLFGISPDGGSGLTEASYFFLLALVVLLFFGRRISRYVSHGRQDNSVVRLSISASKTERSS